MTISEKSVLWYGKWIALPVVFLALAYSVLADGSYTPQAEAIYNETIEKEEQARLVYLKAQYNRCLAEKELAWAKMRDWFNKTRDMTENPKVLEAKSNWTCEGFIPKEEEPITGNFKSTENGGIDEFLKVNGAEFVKEAGDTFRKVGDLYKIKPEVLVAIAQADSSLGNALKTSNNIGNVNNNDRGNTKHYATLEAAIEAMGEVLNNQYLGGYNRIGELSNGGRTKLGMKPCGIEGHCYATSPLNWNKNVVLALQDMFKNTSIDETFNFRQ